MSFEIPVPFEVKSYNSQKPCAINMHRAQGKYESDTGCDAH